MRLNLPRQYHSAVSVAVVSMSLIKNEHGVWCVRSRVAKRLEEAVAAVVAGGKARTTAYKAPGVGDAPERWRKQWK
jgi:hypothetical protein